MNIFQKIVTLFGLRPEAISNPKKRLAFYEYLLEYLKATKGEMNSSFLCFALSPFNVACRELQKEARPFWGRCWKVQEEVKLLQNSVHLDPEVRGNLNCNHSCFFTNDDRIKFINECIALLKKTS
jgi:hypothetical protein